MSMNNCISIPASTFIAGLDTVKQTYEARFYEIGFVLAKMRSI